MNGRVNWQRTPKRKPSNRAEGLGRVGRTDFAPCVRIPLYYARTGR